ncbi:MAG: DUF262 domain-containing protein [Paludibacteraceae bacterium]|nr:DUF262 domain-containing protein [Paludibacteraceae bacterium]MBR6631201.1 DUF262 domain-containing protein [Alistipes sp.]
MKAIHADPKEIRKIFSEKYIIPDFQRPYSWEKEHCDKLWEDIIDFYDNQTSKEDKYFLGNIVIHQSGDSFAVIDGQQRLTTLLLLIKALHSKAGTATVLEECLRIKDPLTSELTDTLRLDSLVADDDKKHLYDIIFNNGNKTPDCNMKSNYVDLCKKIEDWWLKKDNSADCLNKLILCFLDQIVLLPIHCGSEDDALTIFETINNRGMSLTDADIFKAKLHHSAAEDKDNFVKQWNLLDNHEWLFRVLMHVYRAKEGDSTKEIGLRPYFTDSSKNRFSDWKSVIDSLKLIHDVDNNWESSVDVNILWNILKTYPNYYWNFPLYVYLHKYGKYTDDNFVLDGEHNAAFLQLLEYTVKYFFIKGIVYNSVNYVKDTVFKVCVAIESDSDYLYEYAKTITSNDITEFNNKINNKQYGRYLRGLVLLSAYLNTKQDKEQFSEFIVSNYHIEHILPKKWNNYDKWDEHSWADDLNSIGNLMPLEYKLNINAKNEFFNRKKESYSKSKVRDALDVIQYEEWTPENLKSIQDIKTQRLKNYFTFSKITIDKI